MKSCISVMSGLGALASFLFACGGTEAKAPAPDAGLCVPGSKGCDDPGKLPFR